MSEYQKIKADILALQTGQEVCGEYADGNWSVCLTSLGYEVCFCEPTDDPMRPFTAMQCFQSAHEAIGAIGAL